MNKLESICCIAAISFSAITFIIITVAIITATQQWPFSTIAITAIVGSICWTLAYLLKKPKEG